MDDRMIVKFLVTFGLVTDEVWVLMLFNFKMLFRLVLSQFPLSVQSNYQAFENIE